MASRNTSLCTRRSSLATTVGPRSFESVSLSSPLFVFLIFFFVVVSSSSSSSFSSSSSKSRRHRGFERFFVQSVNVMSFRLEKEELKGIFREFLPRGTLGFHIRFSNPKHL
jgi:hypothetical protein